MKCRALSSIPVVLLATLLGCSGSDAGLAESEDLLTDVPSSFVLAAATQPTCMGLSNENVPLGAGACRDASELTFDAATKTLRLARDSRYCLDVQFATKAAGANIMWHPCHGGSNQSWAMSQPLEPSTHLVSAVRVEAFANDGPSNLCISSVAGQMKLAACAGDPGFVLDRRVGDRLLQRGKKVTSLLTLGMIESSEQAARTPSQRSDALPDAAGRLAVSLVEKVMPALTRGEASRVLVVLDDTHHGENAGDAARITQSLRELLTRTQARLEIDVRAGITITTSHIQAVIESELGRIEVSLTERREVLRLMVAITLVVTTTKATVELVDEPAGGITFDKLRMPDGKRPHAVWFSNPGHKINDATSIASLVRFAQRGGGVVVQGDDAAHDTEALTGLRLRGATDQSNGHTYCGQAFDNGSARYPLESRALPVGGMIYTDDLDHAEVADDRAEVLATSNPTCNGTQDKFPAIVYVGADRQ